MKFIKQAFDEFDKELRALGRLFGLLLCQKLEVALQRGLISEMTQVFLFHINGC